jgi:Flp pilus assembly protein TadB
MAFVVAYVAGQKNRSKVGFFWLSIFLSPLIGLLVAIAIPRGSKNANRLSQCPYCKEEIVVDALVCRHCGKELDPETQQKEVLAKVKETEADAEKGRRFGQKLRGWVFLSFGLLWLVAVVSVLFFSGIPVDATVLIAVGIVAVFLYFGISQLAKSRR